MKQNNVKNILIIILILGLALRVAFALTFDISRFQYDIGIEDNFGADYIDYQGLMDFEDRYLTEGGHLYYILTIYNKAQLPQINSNQCYHPPLSQLIYAGFMKIESLITDNSKTLIESLEFVSIIYSILIIIVAYKIMKEIGFEDKETILPISILTFHPFFIFLSRLVNTDGLVSVLSLVCLLYLIKWYKNQTYKNVIILALSIGLGAMTKTSILLMVVPLIFVYTKKIIENVQNSKSVKKIIFQGILFTLLTVPLVFGYQIRNYIKFEQDFFGIAEGVEELSVTNNSFGARWILNHEIFNEIYEMNASNVWANLIISTINFLIDFHAIPIHVSLPLRGMSLILIIISIIGIFKYTLKNENFMILSLTYIMWIIGYISFNNIMPYTCTMHARYIVTAIVIGIIYIGILYNGLKNKKLKNFILFLSLFFVIISILMIVYLIALKLMITRI